MLVSITIEFFYDLASEDDVDMGGSLQYGDMGVPPNIITVAQKIGLLSDGYITKSGDAMSLTANTNCLTEKETMTRIVTQQSPKVINVYQNEKLARESKRQKVMTMAGFCNASEISVTGVAKIPKLAQDGIGTVSGDRKIAFGPRYFATEQVFYSPQVTFAEEEKYIVDHVPKNACGICFGKTLLPVLIDHGIAPTGKPAPCCHALENQSCYNCILPGHFSSKCLTKKMRFKYGYCNRCMISISMHNGEGFGNKCSIQTFDFSWTAAWSVYRNHPLLFKDCVRNISTSSGILLDNDNSVCIWLTSTMTKQPCALNVTRLVVYLLKRQHVQSCSKS